MMVIHAGAHIFPAFTLMETNGITRIDGIFSQAGPHLMPLRMYRFEKFHLRPQFLLSTAYSMFLIKDVK